MLKKRRQLKKLLRALEKVGQTGEMLAKNPTPAMADKAIKQLTERKKEISKMTSLPHTRQIVEILDLYLKAINEVKNGNNQSAKWLSAIAARKADEVIKEASECRRIL